MAIKFSQFITQTSASSLSHIVGYNGADNIQITPADFFTSFAVGSAGQVSFFDTTSSLAGSNDFSWDYTNNRLGIGTSSPLGKLQVNKYTVGSQGNQTIHGELSVFANNGDESLFLGVRDAAYPNRGWAFNPVITGVNSDLQIKEHGQTGIRMTIQSGGNVGIGTTSPTSKLQVSGTLDATGISQLGSSGANVYLTSSSAGNVGIGTSAPAVKLHVEGGNSYTPIRFDGSGNYQGYLYNDGGGIGLKDSAGTNIGNLIYIHTAANNIRLFTNGSEKMRVDSDGVVSIGTTSPSSNTNYGTGDLNVENDLFASAQIMSHNSTQGNYSFLGLGKSSGTGASPTIVQANEIVGTINYYGYDGSAYKPLARVGASVDGTPGAGVMPGRLEFWTTSTSSSTSPIKRMVIDNNGKVGIGTTSPVTKLHVNGDQLIFGDLLLEGSANSFRTVSMNTVDGSDNQSLYLCGGATASTARGGYVKVEGNEVSSAGGTVKIAAGNVSTGDIDFLTANTQRMIINNAGNVGIGTTSPGAKLEVAGDIKTSGDIIIDNSSGDPFLKLKSTAQEYVLRIDQSDSEKFQIRNTTSSVTALSIDTSSNVTFAGDILLSHTGSAGQIIRTTDNNEPYFALQRNGGSNGVGVVRLLDGGDLTFDTGATGAGQATRLTIDGTTGNATFAGQITATKNQITTNIGTTSAIRLKPGSTTNTTGKSSIFLGTSFVDNYGISLRGTRS